MLALEADFRRVLMTLEKPYFAARADFSEKGFNPPKLLKRGFPPADMFPNAFANTKTAGGLMKAVVSQSCGITQRKFAPFI